MTVQLNHTIVAARDSVVSARFLTQLLGLPEPSAFGPFQVVQTGNDVSLDFIDVDHGDEIAPQHYAFLISEAEFDEIYGRIRDRGMAHWADPGRLRAGEINHGDGGRGVYFQDLDGHLLEVITRPYGSGAG